MKIYLSGSIAAGRERLEVYQKIQKTLESLGHTITSPQTTDPNVGEKGEGESGLTPRAIYLRDMSQLRISEAMVAEVTIPSLGVGYEVARALERNLPVLCLFDKKTARHIPSAMIAGNPHPKMTFVEYDDLELLRPIIESFINTLSILS